MENELDIFVFVLGKEFGEFGSYIVIGSANGGFMHDEIDALDVGRSIRAWRDGTGKCPCDLVGCVYGELSKWLVVLLAYETMIGEDVRKKKCIHPCP
jgi:hypothetical protein